MIAVLVTIGFTLNLLGVLFLMITYGRSSVTPSAHHSYPTKEQMRSHILWYSFYINPEDPRGWVPKAYGYGWTLNFRTQKRAFIFGSLVLLQLIFAGLLIWVSVSTTT